MSFRIPCTWPPRGLPRDVRSRIAGVSFGAACLLAVACADGKEPNTASSSGSEAAAAPVRPAKGTRTETFTPEADLAAHMQASFWQALRARDALIAGDLPLAQRAADGLARQDYEALVPAGWIHWTRRIQQYASELTMAPNLGAAAQELGRIALECGECHDVHQDGPKRTSTPPEPWRDPPETLEARMLRHDVGAEQMWQGLAAPSEEAFRSGTITLTRAPFTPPERQGESIDEGLNARVEEVRELARRARAATTYQERGRVYGELVTRCASCHYQLRPAD